MDDVSRLDRASTVKGKEATSLDSQESRAKKENNDRKRRRSKAFEGHSPELGTSQSKVNNYKDTPSPEGDTSQGGEGIRGVSKLSKLMVETNISTQEKPTGRALGSTGFDDRLFASEYGYDGYGTNRARSFQNDPTPEPLWFCRLITMFNCDLVPHILFTQASKQSKEWNNDGELVTIDFSCFNSIFPYLHEMVDDKSPTWMWRATSSLKQKERFAELIHSEDGTTDDLEPISSDKYLGILGILISALPEPRSEFSWEGIEEGLWEVIESTYIPLLGVLDMDDIEEFLSRNMR